MKRIPGHILPVCGIVVILFLGCGVPRRPAHQGLHDGYYIAQAASYDSHGWKEFVSINVSGGRIITAEYGAKNSAGFIKTWDLEYMRKMNLSNGTYPNEYSRFYTTSLLNHQDPDLVDACTGATSSYRSFKILAKAAIAQSRGEIKQVAFVDIPE